MASPIKKLSIIVPVYNEKNTVQELLMRLFSVELSVEKEIIVIDDGSDDGSTELIKEISHKISNVIYLPDNKGKSNAVRLGIGAATGNYIFIQDADLEYNPEEISILIQEISTDTPVVYGSRNLNMNPSSYFLFYIGGIFLTKVTNLLYDQSLTDVPTCYKLFPKKMVNHYLTSENFSVCYEITALIAKQGVKIIEVPINYTPRLKSDGKKITPFDGLGALVTLIKLKFKKVNNL